MLRLLTLAALSLGATPALATQWIHCADASGAASFDYRANDETNALKVDGLTIKAGDKAWVSDPDNGPGDPVSVGKALFDADTVRIDAVDGKSVTVAALRLFATSQDGNTAYGGTLSVPGDDVWGVTCEAQ